MADLPRGIVNLLFTDIQQVDTLANDSSNVRRPEGNISMAGKTTATVPVSSGAEALLAQIKALGTMRYLFANTGTDHGPLIEALAKREKGGPADIQLIVVPHEMAAVSMAHGYYNVTQQPQMVLVHTLPGTANALGGIINAASSNVPLFLVAGRSLRAGTGARAEAGNGADLSRPGGT